MARSSGAPTQGVGPGLPSKRSPRSAWLAQPDLVAVAAILVPGLGHALQGRFRAGLAWAVAILLGYWAVFLPGALLHAISVLAAYRRAALDGAPAA